MIVQTIVKYVVIVAFIFILVEILKQYFNKLKGESTALKGQKSITIDMKGKCDCHRKDLESYNCSCDCVYDWENQRLKGSEQE